MKKIVLLLIGLLIIWVFASVSINAQEIGADAGNSTPTPTQTPTPTPTPSPSFTIVLSNPRFTFTSAFVASEIWI